MALFDQLADRVSAALWNLHPGRAVRLGKHEYDGQVPDLSADALVAGQDRLRRLRGQLSGLTGREAARGLESAVLAAAIDAELLDGEGPAGWRRSPGRYLEPLDVDLYRGRDYAPAGLRRERAASVLERAGEVLAAARANLDPVLARVAVEWAVGHARARADRLDEGWWPGDGAPDPAGEQWLQAAAAGAAAELRAYAGWLEGERLPRAEEACALGTEVVERTLWEGGPAAATPAEVAGRARLMLEQDRAALGPAPVEADPAPLDSPGRALRSAISEAAAFLRRAGAIAPPREVPLTVVEDPGVLAGGTRLDAPGPYDDASSGAVVRLGPPPGGWAVGALHSLAVTVAYPGRLLQGQRRAGAPGEVLRRFGSRGFEEGWALHAGEWMWEAGYRRDDPAWRRAWLHRAQRADCRLACVWEVHGGGMSLEQAGRFFMEQVHCDEATARREAIRLAVDPACAAAALGRLEILDVRRRWAERPPDPGSGAFPDALLAHGAPPLGLLAGAVLA